MFAPFHLPFMCNKSVFMQSGSFFLILIFLVPIQFVSIMGHFGTCFTHWLRWSSIKEKELTHLPCVRQICFQGRLGREQTLFSGSIFLISKAESGSWTLFLQRVKPVCWILATGLLCPTKLVGQQMWAEFFDTILQFCVFTSLHLCLKMSLQACVWSEFASLFQF